MVLFRKKKIDRRTNWIIQSDKNNVFKKTNKKTKTKHFISSNKLEKGLFFFLNKQTGAQLDILLGGGQDETISRPTKKFYARKLCIMLNNKNTKVTNQIFSK